MKNILLIVTLVAGLLTLSSADGIRQHHFENDDGLHCIKTFTNIGITETITVSCDDEKATKQHSKDAGALVAEVWKNKDKKDREHAQYVHDMGIIHDTIQARVKLVRKTFDKYDGKEYEIQQIIKNGRQSMALQKGLADKYQREYNAIGRNYVAQKANGASTKTLSELKARAIDVESQAKWHIKEHNKSLTKIKSLTTHYKEIIAEVNHKLEVLNNYIDNGTLIPRTEFKNEHYRGELPDAVFVVAE